MISRVTVSIKNRAFMLLLCAILTFGILGMMPESASAKAGDSDAVANAFFYAVDSKGDSTLLTVMNVRDELLEDEHGAVDGKNYSCLTIDRFPATNYCEGRGFLLDELIQKAVDKSADNGNLDNVEELAYTGENKLAMMTTDNQTFPDNFENYTYNDLYGVKRYFFPDLYDVFKVRGADYITGPNFNGDPGYHDDSAEPAPYYFNAERNAIFDSGIESPAYIATSSYSGRVNDLISQDLLPASVTGEELRNSLDDKLDQKNILRIVIPQTEEEMRTGKSTTANVRKWIYGFQLKTASSSPITAKGKVSVPTCSFKMEGSTLKVTMNCSTAGAEIYHSYDAESESITATPQYKYTEPIEIENYDGEPVKMYMRAVKEGYSDSGIISQQWAPSGTDVEILKNIAIGQIENYVALVDYRAAEQVKVKEAIKKATKEIEAATTETQIDKALANGKKIVDKIPTAAQMGQEEKRLGKQGGVKATPTSYSINKVSWSRNSKADGYQVYRTASKAGSYVKVADIKGSTKTSYTNSGLKTGTTYYYKVRAYKALGDSKAYGQFSSADTAKPALSKTTVKLKAGKHLSSIRWKKVSGASGYVIYRSSKKFSGYRSLKTITRGSTTKYTNKKLKKGKVYYYKVRAYRTVSGKKVYSSYSTVKAVRVK